MALVTSQPFAINAPVAAFCERNDEKGCSHEQYGHQYSRLHDIESRRCGCKRRRRLIVRSIALALFVTMFCMGILGLWDATFDESSLLKGVLGMTVDGDESSWAALSDLMKRQSNSSTINNSPFVDHKCSCCQIAVL